MTGTKKSVPKAECKRKHGQLHVRVIWDDASKGASHFIPVTRLKCDSELVGGAKVSMRHSKRNWSGTISISDRHKAALSLVEGKIKHVIMVYIGMKT